MAKRLTEENINKYTSKTHYNNFEKGIKGCEGLEFSKNIKRELNKSDEYKKLLVFFEKIVSALCYIYNEKRKDTEVFNEELCRYLYYWLGDKINSLKYDKRIFKQIIRMIYGELNNNTEMIVVCSYHDYNIYDLDKYETHKLLFNYSKDFQNIENDTRDNQRPCDEYYYKFIEKYISIYKQAHSECKNKNKNTNFFCNYFSRLFQENEYNKLSSFTCIQRDNIEPVLEKRKEHEHEGHARNQPYGHASVTPTPPKETAARDANLGMNHITYSPEYPETIETIQMGDTTEGGHSKSITGSVAPVLGVPFISFLIYRFTPAGGFINKLIGRNRNMYNPIEDIDGSNSHSDGIVDGSRRINISYHRL